MAGVGHSGGRAVAIAGAAVLAIVVGVLAFAAYQHGQAGGTTSGASPVPTFSLGATTQTASPTPSVEEQEADASAAERFLAASAGVMWRGVAGVCGDTTPVLERSDDGGVTWIDVTPTYREIGQLAAVDVFADTEGEIVAAMGADCETQALRTFTQGEFWESYPEVLAASRFIDMADPSVVWLAGQQVDAPCSAAHGLRAAGSTVALICEGAAYTWAGDDWSQLTESGAVALATVAGGVAVAHSAEDCDGVAVTAYADANAASPDAVGCVDVADPADPAALVVNPSGASGFLLWSGDELIGVG
jgi:hypothetical protein